MTHKALPFAIIVLLSLLSAPSGVPGEGGHSSDLAAMLPHSTFFYAETSSFQKTLEGVKGTASYKLIADPDMLGFISALAALEGDTEALKSRTRALLAVARALSDTDGNPFEGNLALSVIGYTPDGVPEVVLAMKVIEPRSEKAWKLVDTVAGTLGVATVVPAGGGPGFVSNLVGGYMISTLRQSPVSGLDGMSFTVNDNWMMMAGWPELLERLNSASAVPPERSLASVSAFARDRADLKPGAVRWFFNYNHYHLATSKNAQQVPPENPELGALAALNPFSNLNLYIDGICGTMDFSGADVIETTHISFLTEVEKLAPISFLSDRPCNPAITRFFPQNPAVAAIGSLDFSRISTDPLLTAVFGEHAQTFGLSAEDLSECVSSVGPDVGIYLSMKGFSPDALFVATASGREKITSVMDALSVREDIPVRVEKRELDGESYYMVRQPGSFTPTSLCISGDHLFIGPAASIKAAITRAGTGRNFAQSTDNAALSQWILPDQSQLAAFIDLRQFFGPAYASAMPALLWELRAQGFNAPVPSPLSLLKAIRPFGVSVSRDSQSVTVRTAGNFNPVGLTAVNSVGGQDGKVLEIKVAPPQ